jgi:hypothetical protein
MMCCCWYTERDCNKCQLERVGRDKAYFFADSVGIKLAPDVDLVVVDPDSLRILGEIPSP